MFSLDNLAAVPRVETRGQLNESPSGTDHADALTRRRARPRRGFIEMSPML
jgi:hypothetical protein